MYQTPNGQMEPKLVHWIKIFMLVDGIYVLLQIVLILITIISSAFIICFMLYWEYKGRNIAAQRMNERNQELIKAMRIFDFSNLLFSEATECVICLQTFKSDDKIVQLRCSKFHIFHFECLKDHMNSNSESNEKCPLCRQTIRVQNPPILE